VPCQHPKTEVFFKQNKAEFGQFCYGEPWNFVNWPAEFCKIYHRKLWALNISNVNDA